MKQNYINKKNFLRLSVLLSGFSLTIAFIAQYLQGIIPCDLCLYERCLYIALIGVGLTSFFNGGRFYFPFVLIIIVISILLAAYHLGVEWRFWQAPKTCRSINIFHPSFEDYHAAFMKKPLIHCDQAGWIILGVSATLWNFLFWLGLGLAGVYTLKKSK